MKSGVRRNSLKKSKLQVKQTASNIVRVTQKSSDATPSCWSSALPVSPQLKETFRAGNGRYPKGVRNAFAETKEDAGSLQQRERFCNVRDMYCLDTPMIVETNKDPEHLSPSLGIPAAFNDDQVPNYIPGAAYQTVIAEGKSQNNLNFTLSNEPHTLGQPQKLCEQSMGQYSSLQGPICAAELLRAKERYVQTSEHLNDVLDAASINLRLEQKEMLQPLTKRNQTLIPERDAKLFLEKELLHDKIISIAKQCGLLSVNEDVELCLSVSIEEWFRGVLYKLLRFSNKRLDIEKEDQKILVTSNVGGQIHMLREKARKALLEAEVLAKHDEAERLANEQARF